MTQPRPWEVAETREIPDWEREYVEKMEPWMVLGPREPWDFRHLDMTFPEGLPGDTL